MLIVTARNPLQVSYGSQGYAQVRAALDAWANVEGHSVLAVDDAEDMQRFGLDARSNNPADVQLAIRSVAATYPKVVDAVLVAGGPSVIPFWTLSNPVTSRTTDPDVTVLSDNPYGAIAETMKEYLAPSRVVGRLAVPDGASASQFVAMTQGLPHRTGTTPAGKQGAALVVNQDWVDYSQRVAQTMPEPQTWWLSPGFELDADSEQAAARAILYFNLHGFSGDSDWQGYSTIQRSFVSAVTPDGLDRSFVAGAVSFAECCYGAQIAGRTPNNSCALKLVQEGASFIGATGLAFGSYIASDLVLEDADFLARAFFQELGAGAPLGGAMQQARNAYLSDSTEAQSGEIWQCKQKTLLQFVLYGNPQTIP
jgi:hypothetical protein